MFCSLNEAHPSFVPVCMYVWPRFASVRLRFGDGMVRAVPVFGSPNLPLSGASELLFLAEERQLAGAGFWGGVWSGCVKLTRFVFLAFFREAPVRLWFGDGTVQAVPVFGSGGSSEEGVFVCVSTV